MLAPSKGRVEYGDRTSGQGGAAVRAQIGMLGHDLFLYPELTAHENLTFFAHLYGLANVPAVVDSALERASLSTRAHDYVGGFSRGMRQRVALERALLHDPRLILLDEPFTGLDQASTRALVARLQERQSAGLHDRPGHPRPGRRGWRPDARAVPDQRQAVGGHVGCPRFAARALPGRGGAGA